MIRDTKHFHDRRQERRVALEHIIAVLCAPVPPVPLRHGKVLWYDPASMACLVIDERSKRVVTTFYDDRGTVAAARRAAAGRGVRRGI